MASKQQVWALKGFLFFVAAFEIKDVEPSPLGDEEGKVVLLALGNEISSLSPPLGWFCLW